MVHGNRNNWLFNDFHSVKNSESRVFFVSLKVLFGGVLSWHLGIERGA